MNLSRSLGIEIHPVHIGDFLLFFGALAILSLNVPLWAVFADAPLVRLGALVGSTKPPSYCRSAGTFCTKETSRATISLTTTNRRIKGCKN